MLKNIVLALFFIGLIVLGAYIHFLKYDMKRSRNQTSTLINQQRQTLDSLEQNLVMCEQQNSLPDSTLLKKLYEMGFVSPETELLHDLQQRNTEFLDEMVSGDTLLFKEVALINEKWLIAQYDDGNTGGELLMEYQKKEDNQIAWKLLAKQEEQ